MHIPLSSSSKGRAFDVSGTSEKKRMRAPSIGIFAASCAFFSLVTPLSTR